MLKKEGGVRFEVPAGEVKKSDPVFYNPVMEFPRDVSIAIYKAFFPQGGDFLDALAGSGVRAIRMAKEVGMKVTANDLNPSAVKLIEKNANMNKTKVEVTKRNASSLMFEQCFAAVDVDPFGSPAPFIDAAVISAKRLLSVTATDTAVLCGTYPKTCWRRYLAWPQLTDFLHELGVRILVGYIIRMAGRNDIALTPVFAHSQYHYYRTYFTVKGGAGKVNKLLDKISTISWNSKTLEREESDGSIELGPIWTGPLWDKELAKKAAKEAASLRLGTKKEVQSLFNVVLEEADLPAYYFDIHRVCKVLKIPCPRFEKIISELNDAGFKASRTSFSPVGIRADCKLAELKDLLSLKSFEH